MIRFALAAVLTSSVLLSLHATAAAPEPVPADEEVRKAVRQRRGSTALAKLAAEMKPGTWAELETDMPKGIWSSPQVDGGRNKGGAGGLHIAGWTDDAHWDSRTGQFLYMGLRQTRQFIAYSEETNAWRVIPLDRANDNPVFQTRFGHVYGTNAFDHERSRFYHLYRDFKELKGGISYFDAATETWTKLPPTPDKSGGMAIEYFKAMDGLVVLGKQTWFFSNQRQKWEDLGTSPVDGYHSLFRHNPYRDEVLMMGGNHNPQVVARLKKDGTIERLKDFPVSLSVQSDKVTVDPATCRYLILGGHKEESKKLYEFDSDENEYRVVEVFMAGWPFKRNDMPVTAFVPEHGVTMWAENAKVYLYKHGATAGGTDQSNAAPATKPASAAPGTQGHHQIEHRYLTGPVTQSPKPVVDRQVLRLYAEGNKAFDPKADVRAPASAALEVLLPPADRSTAPAGVATAASIVPMPLVPWDKESEAVRVTADGVAVPVGEWVAAGKEPQVRYCHFDTAKAVTVTVTFPKPPPKEQPLPVASNDRARIVPEATGADRKTWRFTMHPNTKVYLKLHRTFICASAPDPDAPKPNDPGVINVAGRGAKADGSASATKVIQAAIDEASEGAGKSVVYLPAGVYASGTLFMRDGVTLYLAAGAVLRGSEDPAEWRHRAGAFYDGTSAFIFFGNDVEAEGKAVGVRNAAVRGRGVIDGNGAFFRPAVVDGKPGNNPYFYEGDKTQKARLIFAMQAENCRVEGVTLRNPVFWTTHVLASRKFDFTDVKVYANYRLNNDGLNYDGCTDSTIDNCVMITGDDSHCLKNEYVNGLGGPNARIRMANSITAGFGMGIKFGWAFHQAHDCTYENNWLAGGNFGIHVGRKPIRVAGPKIAEVTGLTLRDMVIEGNLSVDAVGKAIDGYKLSDIKIENTRVDGKFDVKNTTGLRITALTVAGKPIGKAEDLPGVTNCTDVVVRAK